MVWSPCKEPEVQTNEAVLPRSRGATCKQCRVHVLEAAMVIAGPRGLCSRADSHVFFGVSLDVLNVPVPQLASYHRPATPSQSRGFKEHLTEAGCRTGPGGVRAHRGDSTGTPEKCGVVSLQRLPSQAPQEALARCSGSPPGSGAEAGCALLPTAPSFLPSTSCASSCEPRVALSWLSPQTGPVSGLQ